MQHVQLTVQELDFGLVLAPERYDPRRTVSGDDGIAIRRFAMVVRDSLSPSRPAEGKYLVLDTSDAAEGFLRRVRAPQSVASLGSAKKIAQPGDVIISRLRPYLRQVAFVDDGLVDPNVGVALSTEFIILRSVDSESIAFLVPYLLSESVQAILAVSQEGGHHPRIAPDTVQNLKVPEAILEGRRDLSAKVERVVALARSAEQQMDELTGRLGGIKAVRG